MSSGKPRKTRTIFSWDDVEYMECSECKKKNGSQYLCDVCLHNRQLIDMMKKTIKTLKDVNLILKFKNKELLEEFKMITYIPKYNI